MTKHILYSLFALGLMIRPAPADAQAAQQPPAPAATPAPAETPVPVIAIVGEDYRFEVQVGGLVTMPSTVRLSDTETVGSGATATTLNGTNIDFKKDLGLKNQVFPEVHLTIRVAPKHKLRGEYTPLYYKQTTTLAADIAFNGQRYLAGQTVESTLHWNEWNAAYEFDPIVVDRGYIGGIAGVSSLNVSGATANTAQSGTASVNIVMPGLGVTGRFYALGKLSVTGDFLVFDLPGGAASTHGHIIQASGYATYNFTKHIGAHIGYRYFDTDHYWSSPVNTGSMRIGGPYVGGTAHF